MIKIIIWLELNIDFFAKFVKNYKIIAIFAP